VVWSVILIGGAAGHAERAVATARAGHALQPTTSLTLLKPLPRCAPHTDHRRYRGRRGWHSVY
jgi:hypothetical protein